MLKLISETRLMWDMPITVAVVEPTAFPETGSSAQPGEGNEYPGALQQAELRQAPKNIEALISGIFDYFQYVDDKFSTFKPLSEISMINQGLLSLEEASLDMQSVIALGEEIRQETNGYFNIARHGRIDPLGLVKGWALSNAADKLREAGCENFYVEAGGDFQAVGLNAEGQPWRVGIRNPFNIGEIVKVLAICDRGVATSGTYIRGQHIDNPVSGGPTDPEILSITVIGPDVYEADCYATAAFAMGRAGIGFIDALEGFEGYMIDINKTATYTRGFERYVNHASH